MGGTCTTGGVGAFPLLMLLQVADLVVFAPEAVRETATFESPHQLAEGFDWVVISGQVAFQSGQGAMARLGRVLKPLE